MINNSYYEIPFVNMDDLRLLCCMWRQAHRFSATYVGRAIGLSSSWIGSFEHGYGMKSRPYPSNMLQLLTLMGYPVGVARAMIRELYPDIGYPTYWYLMKAEDFAIQMSLENAGLDHSKILDIMRDIEYDNFVRYTDERKLESCLFDERQCKYHMDHDIFTYHCSETQRLKCICCKHNHICKMSKSDSRCTCVGSILDEAYSDHTLEVERFLNNVCQFAYRVVTKRFHHIIDDNDGEGYYLDDAQDDDLTCKQETELIERAKTML